MHPVNEIVLVDEFIHDLCAYKAVSPIFMEHVEKIPVSHEQTNNKLILMKQQKANLDI